MTIRENVTLANLKAITKWMFLDLPKERQVQKVMSMTFNTHPFY
jgi:hypothetical protein